MFYERGFQRPNITKILNVLYDAQLIARPRLKKGARTALFGSDGSRLAVAITRQGEEKIEEFKTVLQTEFDDWCLRQSLVVRGALNIVWRPAVEFARVLAKKRE
jgi:hypothetical protein